MRNFLIYSKILPGFLLLIMAFPSVIAQSTHIDSILTTRQVLLKTYDSSRMAVISDTGESNLIQVVKTAKDLIEYDNNLLNDNIKKILLANDSLSRLNTLHESGVQNQNLKIRNLYNSLFFTSGIGIAGLVLFFVMLIAWYKRRKKINRLSKQHIETENILTEYRKRLNELQSDLDNSRTQAKTLVNDNTRLEKEMSLITDEIQKARDAGWLTESGQVSYPEQIKALEEQLIAESTRKKILEQEILEILRKLRGED